MFWNLCVFRQIAFLHTWPCTVCTLYVAFPASISSFTGYFGLFCESNSFICLICPVNIVPRSGSVRPSRALVPFFPSWTIVARASYCVAVPAWTVPCCVFLFIYSLVILLIFSFCCCPSRLVCVCTFFVCAYVCYFVAYLFVFLLLVTVSPPLATGS